MPSYPFVSTQYSSVNYMHIIVWQISIFCISKLKHYTLSNNSHFPLTHTEPLATIILLSVSKSLTNLDMSYKWNQAIFTFLTRFFSLAYYPRDSPTFYHMGRFSSFVKLNNTSLYVYFTCSYSFSNGHLDYFKSQLLWVILHWRLVWKCHFEILIPFPLVIYPEAELQDHMVVLFVIFRGLHTIFHNGYPSLHSHEQCTKVPISLFLVSICYFSFIFIFVFIYLFHSSYSNKCGVMT